MPSTNYKLSYNESHAIILRCKQSFSSSPSVFKDTTPFHISGAALGPLPEPRIGRQLHDAEVPAVANPPVAVAVQEEHAHHHDHAHDRGEEEETHVHSGTESHDQHGGHDEHGHEHNEHKSIGVSLVVGFVFMLIVDQFGGGHSHGGGGRKS